MPVDEVDKLSTKQSPLLFALVDCNNFFVSCERVFDPRLEGRPVVVLSNNDACIISRSNEAKKLGIKIGMPLYQVWDLVKNNRVCVLSANFTLYRDLSHRIVHSLRQFCPDIEVYSVDEVFMILKEADSRVIDRLIRNMRQTVYRWVGVPVSIGVAETKTLAKLAAEHAKKKISTGGRFDLSACSQQDRDRVLAGTPVDDIWGIGRQYGKWLTDRGITTALQLQGIDQHWFGKKAGVTGLRLLKELQGVSCISLDLDDPPRKAITCSRSFGKLVTDLGELKEAIATFAAQGGRELRHDCSLARRITVYCGVRSKSAPSKTSSTITVHLPLPTDCDSDLIRAALTGLEQIYQLDVTYYKGGITLSDLSRADVRQADIFVDNEHNRLHKLSGVIDHLNAHWGHGTIRYAAAGIKRSWQSHATLCSPNYTTRWQELPVAHTAPASVKRAPTPHKHDTW
ncbi:MAG: Y-family DNA polymerase [candidate division Zixibacteria bacterium]|nr:Y-family DNA polymerase [candidate division Zixibacteria bacterium]